MPSLTTLHVKSWACALYYVVFYAWKSCEFLNFHQASTSLCSRLAPVTAETWTFLSLLRHWPRGPAPCSSGLKPIQGTACVRVSGTPHEAFERGSSDLHWSQSLPGVVSGIREDLGSAVSMWLMVGGFGVRDSHSGTCFEPKPAFLGSTTKALASRFALLVLMKDDGPGSFYSHKAPGETTPPVSLALPSVPCCKLRPSWGIYPIPIGYFAVFWDLFLPHLRSPIEPVKR